MSRGPVGPWLGMALLLLVLSTGATRPASGQPATPQALLEQGRRAGADVEKMQMVLTRARQAGLSDNAAAALLRPTLVLARQDLPTGPLLSKTLEGLAKRVPATRMRPVLQQYRANTERAGQLVSRWTQRDEVRQFLGETSGSKKTRGQSSAPLVSAVTEAQQQDVPAQHIETFLTRLPADVSRRPVSIDAVATAVRVMPPLSGNSASPQTARQLLTSALNAGYSPESLRQLPSALQRAHQKSQRPVNVLAQGTARAITRGTPAASVLQQLFQGGAPPGAGNGPPGGRPGPGKPPDTGPPGDPGNGPPGGNPGNGTGNGGQGGGS